MFNPTLDEVKLINRKRSLPKPGRVHGSGGIFKGSKNDKHIVPNRSVNKNNPGIRGQTNMIQGRFVEQHDSDDVTPIVASMATGNAVSGIKPRRVYRPLRTR